MNGASEIILVVVVIINVITSHIRDNQIKNGDTIHLGKAYQCKEVVK